MNQGKNTIGSIFMTNGGKVSKITELTHNIQNADKEIECFDVFIKVMVLQLNQATIPFFKRDKVRIYNEMMNDYAGQMVNNSMVINACFSKVLAANKRFFGDDFAPQNSSIHQY
mmetsp:Transcript_15043/g.14619  ORF Transcript_15043/g.14619 Transcript_15043/m.14619 type:complete len:114 (+) Transcript_15043:1676-2017(+)